LNKSILDTDILSEIGKGIDPTVAGHAAADLAAFGRYTLSAVTVMEVIRGLEKRQSVRRLAAFRAALPSMEVLPFAGAADLAGRIAAELDRIGQPIGLADTMIAALALEHGLELVPLHSKSDKLATRPTYHRFKRTRRLSLEFR
jgi:predicted nucleic acid-binding protein